MKTNNAHVRIARPTLEPSRIRRFYTEGLGMSILYEGDAQVEDRRWELVMCGFKNSGWHLEFIRSEPHTIVPSPTPEDLLVFYLGDHSTVREVSTSLERLGGSTVTSESPYWDAGGIRSLTRMAIGWSSASASGAEAIQRLTALTTSLPNVPRNT